MLTKWERTKPNKFTDYLTLPSRWNLGPLLVGMYNYCWNYQRVAEAVALRYADADRHLRAEMVTSQLIAHRRGRMLNGFDGFDIENILSRTRQMNPTGGWVTRYAWDNDRQQAVCIEDTKPIPERITQ